MFMFVTLPQAFLQECMMSAYFCLMNSTPIHAANDNCIVKGNLLLFNILQQSM